MHPRSPVSIRPRAQGDVRGLSAARPASSQAGGREQFLMCACACWPMQPDSLALVLSLSPCHPSLAQPRGTAGLLCFLLSTQDCPHVEILLESAGLTLPACAELRSCINLVMQITDSIPRLYASLQKHPELQRTWDLP